MSSPMWVGAPVGASNAAVKIKDLHVIIVNITYKKINNEADGTDLDGMATATRNASPLDTIIIPAGSMEAAMFGIENHIPMIGKGAITRLTILDHSIEETHTRGLNENRLHQTIGKDLITGEQLKQFEPYLAPEAILDFQGCLIGLDEAYLHDSSVALNNRSVYGYNYLNIPKPYFDRKTNQILYLPLENPVDNPNFTKSK